MARIAGFFQPERKFEVERMLKILSNEKYSDIQIFQNSTGTIGILRNEAEKRNLGINIPNNIIYDGIFNGDIGNITNDCPLALAAINDEGFILSRDHFGVSPLYYGEFDGSIIFASEVKGLLEFTIKVNEFPPGNIYLKDSGFKKFYTPEEPKIANLSKTDCAKTLHQKLDFSIQKFIKNTTMGSWLSGGLDSSIIATLAKKHIKNLHTFAVGLAGAPDLEYADVMANYLKSKHHKIIVTLDDLLELLPTVIYHLESFDALLVRSSLTNYIAGKIASDYVPEVFSGEGGDELFGGYSYLKNIPIENLNTELNDITGRLHNTALQRVDRSSACNGIKAYVPFLDPEVVQYAMMIPPELKICQRNGEKIEKWILRKAFEKELPEKVLWRSKEKFWEGTGIKELISDHAEKTITDNEFVKESGLMNGMTIRSKEELLYFRIFNEHFRTLVNYDFMGRTKITN